jgi:hypothetical protein
MNVFILVKNHSNVNIVRRALLPRIDVEYMNVHTLLVKNGTRVNIVRRDFYTRLALHCMNVFILVKDHSNVNIVRRGL